ncbi:MAG: Hpt domain-containing protein [Candidatus Sericytochromatia bacterium]|nr:Hpt domain-containing protein [Candidatus Sericytochromatia bacterium]
MTTGTADLLDLIDDAIAVADPETWELETANAAFWQWLKRPPVSGRLDSLLPELQVPEVQAALAEHGKHVWKASGATERGRLFPAEFTLRRITRNGQAVLALHGRNIVRLAESEMMLKSFTKLIDDNNRVLRRQKQAVSDLLDNMRQAIFMINPRGKVEREFSAYSQTIFGSDRAIAGEHIMALLQLTPEQDPSAHERMSFWLSNIFGGDDLQWLLAEELAIPATTYQRSNGDGTAEARRLELEYAPIYEDDVIVKVMVIVKDVTVLRRLAAEVTDKERQHAEVLQRVSELAGMDPGLFETFLTESGTLIDQGRDALDHLATTPHDTDGIHRLFRALHTLKGNARIFQVTTVQDRAHVAEASCQAVRDGDRALTPEVLAELRNDLGEIESVLAELNRLGGEVLWGAQADGGRRQASGPVVKVPETRVLGLRRAYKDLARLIAGLPVPELAEPLADLAKAVQGLTLVPFGEIVERYRPMIGDLCRDLGKPAAALDVSGAEALLDAKLTDRLGDVFLHALRNALDHGIEAPGDRETAGKTAQGKITISCALADGAVTVEVSDDGRGIDLDQVREIAYRKRFLTEEALEATSETDLLQLLFRPGFSTAAQVTEVSGRGVGMDVIRAAVIDLKGDAVVRSRFGQGTTLRLAIPADYYQRL